MQTIHASGLVHFHAYQIVKALNPMLTMSKNLLNGGYPDKELRLNRIQKAAAMMFTQRIAGYFSVKLSTAIRIGIIIKAAIPTHIP